MELRERKWTRFIDQTQKTTEVVGELSKLYIVFHQQVRNTILKCTLDMHYDPSSETHAHLSKILQLLDRINDPEDSYLRGIDPSILTKFQQQLLDLAQQVKKVHQTSINLKSINPKALQKINNPNIKEPFDLREQLKRSQNRRMRSRSGKRVVQINKKDKDIPDQAELIQKFQEYKKAYLKKKNQLQKNIQDHVEYNSNKVNFSKKYAGSNLQDYFCLRRELADLMLAEQHAKKMVQSPASKEEVTPIQHGTQQLFPEFKIKTKFMKNHVRQNICKALASAKMQLLRQFHASNVKTLINGNPDSMISLDSPKKKRSLSELKIKNIQSASTSSNLRRYSQDIKIKTTVSRFPMADRSKRPLIYEKGWTQGFQQQQIKNMEEKIRMGRVQNSRQQKISIIKNLG